MKPVLLKCFLGKSGDTKNMLILYDQLLVVICKGQRMDFPLSSIKALVVKRKKLIIPLVVGGIGTCLSWLALHLGWYDYYLNLMIVFLFFGWMYYGLMGRDALELIEGKIQHIFLITANQFVLNTFLKFTKERQFLMQSARGTLSFHLSTKASWEAQEQSTLYSHPSLETEGFIHTSYFSELQHTYNRYFQPFDQLILIGIDLSKVEAPVKVKEVTSRNAQFPHLYGKLNKSAIVFLRAVQGPEDLQMDSNISLISPH
ncbi:MAG: DUF952 domain-containing protein [Reichenbachiella sp.]|uniref:DUF952 domain-containing protein n=1 Tax=Reichenbachiella sp. TaxID=2184521 RepID=UPI0032673341